MRNSERPSRRRLASRGLPALVIILLLLEGAALAAVSSGPPVRASASARDQGNGLSATVTVHLGLSGLRVRASLLPGSLGHRARDPAVVSLDDSRFPYQYGNPTEGASDGAWVSLYLSDLASPARPHLAVIDSGQLAGVLARHPGATLLIFNSGVIPSSLVGANASGLRSWIAAGGTLVWGGGPIGYAEGYVDDSGNYVSTNLGWQGQVDLLGFNLTGPGPAGVPKVENVTPTPLATALGLEYDFPGYGANVSELIHHGGTAVGFDTVAGTGSAAAERTSIAYLPVGAGAIWDFGSGTGAPEIAELPGASAALSQDTALLLSLGYVPAAGVPVSTLFRVGSLGTETVTLALPDRSEGVVVAVTSRIPGSILYAWSEQLVPAPDPLGRRRVSPLGSADRPRSAVPNRCRRGPRLRRAA